MHGSYVHIIEHLTFYLNSYGEVREMYPYSWKFDLSFIKIIHFIMWYIFKISALNFKRRNQNLVAYVRRESFKKLV